MLTAAEFLALAQVLNSGQQSLEIGTAGVAVGGTFSLNNLPPTALGSLLIPQGVSLIHDFGQSQTINIAGNLTNAGSLFGVSSNPSVTSALISASNIFNQGSGLISSVLPPSLAGGPVSFVSSLDLVLSAVHDIVNAGQIFSSGNLTALAGGAIVNSLPAGAAGQVPVMQAISSLNLLSNSATIVNSGLMS